MVGGRKGEGYNAARGLISRDNAKNIFLKTLYLKCVDVSLFWSMEHAEELGKLR